MVYFISGHRNIDQEFFDRYYKPLLEAVLQNDPFPKFVVGDCEGVDTMAQDWLEKNVTKDIVTVYHMYDSPRHNAGPFKTVGGFKSDIERDEAMTRNSDIDVAYIMKGRWTSGTAQNILRRYEVSDK